MPTATLLDEHTLQDLQRAIFRHHIITTSAAADGLCMADVEATVTQIRRDMRRTLQTLPERAFVEQADDASGGEVWSAGEVLHHVCDVARNIYCQALAIAAGQRAGYCAPLRDEFQHHPRLSRSEAVALLDHCDREMAFLFGSCSPVLDLGMPSPLGTIGSSTLGGTLLAFALHEFEHLQQLRRLA